MSDRNPEYSHNIPGVRPPPPASMAPAQGPQTAVPGQAAAPAAQTAPAPKRKPGSFPIVAIGIVVFGFAVAALVFSLLARVLAASRAETARATIALAPAPEIIIEEVPVAEEEKVENLAVVTQVKRELPELKLEGILYSKEQGSAALINGKVVPEGGMVKGVTLVRVLPDKVELDFEGRRVFMRSL